MESDGQLLRDIRAAAEDIRSDVRKIEDKLGAHDLGTFVICILLGLILWRVW